MQPTTYKSILGLTIFIFSSILFAQETDTKKFTASNKGKFYASWGGNRASFSQSDIHFTGENYDFTIKNATADDKGKGWHIDYINPTRLTIPQTNAKLGYFISDKYSVALGLDHMKYVMTRNKYRAVEGYINLPDQEPGSIYNKTYRNQYTFVSEDFLKFEHTDGLNYIHAEISRHDDISSLFKIKNTDIFQINISEGISGGILLPRTNSTLLGKERYDQFHLSGYGMSLRAGLDFTFFKHFFIQLDLKGGYINMNDIRTTNNSTDKASQHFMYLQRVVAFGGKFRL
ncbi:membrane protein [Postechiella marina]|uniref:Membrane protein n=1 Tax=Postechiella marina TaxID=943941 RepID=A0ABP8CES7_9FLAO